MEVIQPAHLNQRPSLAPLLGATVVATFSIVFGIVIAYMAIATPVLKAVIPEGRLNAGQAATGIIVWSIALVAPTAFVLIGANRLVRILAATRARTPRRSATLRALDSLPDDVVVATGIAMPDGRPISDLVIGPFGAAVVRELPPAAVTRVRDGRLATPDAAWLDRHREPARARRP